MVRKPLASLVDIQKSYEDLPVLKGVTLDLFSGEILGLVGPNGSGKTTLTSILCGSTKPDSGEIWIGGKRVEFRSSADAISRGIRSLPQAVEIYPELSVLENIFVGQELTKRWLVVDTMDWRRMADAAKSLLTQVDANQIDPQTKVKALSGGQQKAVMLARLLATQAKLLVFDEPAAALGVRQKARLLDLLRAEADCGRSVVFISHDVEDVLRICDRVVALRKGHISIDSIISEVDAEQLSVHMVTA